MQQKIIRNVFYYKNYFLDFFNQLQEAEQKKFDWTLELIATTERIPSKFFKHMEGTAGLYEIRVEVSNNSFRVFAFFDEGQLIVVANGFRKKTQKTPKAQIEMALKLKNEYFHEKPKS